MPRRPNTNRNVVPAKLNRSMVLCRFMFSQLTASKDIDGMSESLNDPQLEGIDETGTSRFYHALIDRSLLSGEMPEEKLLEYDDHIRVHTDKINAGREDKLEWKYFQYLSLLFTEMYLDRYFNGRERLLEDLNDYLQSVFNSEAGNYQEIEPFTPDDLGKLAFWNATGSGKTLLMHMNILQYLYYYEHSDKRDRLNRIILLTPNEGLTDQHLDELKLSGIDAVNFTKESGNAFLGKTVEVMEITKLADENGDKTVAVGSFESNNLVLVDEGHKGKESDSKWRDRRNKISETGFCFEYSATFGQAIASASGRSRINLLNEYAHSTLFDYSYKHFYNDGYGKDYNILNLSHSMEEEQSRLYLTACLLSFYEQTLFYHSQENAIRPFLIEKPLAIFVGSSVTASVSDRDASDVETIIDFFQHFINDSRESIDFIGRILAGNDGLVDENTHRSIFNRSFAYLRETGKTAQDIFADMLQKIFNSSVAGANLYIEDLKGLKGEIGMRVGNAEYFGVINVGDSAGLIRKLAKLAKDKPGVRIGTKDFNDKSLFATINEEGSKVNVLIGSKKFTEGWSSWRVSTMGLMNIGVNEGSQIIQLFGRGVRLKGFAISLKRSKELKGYDNPPIPKYLDILETLNIFGIHADYMEKFKEYLEEEGIKTGDGDESGYEEISIDTMLTVNFGKTKLKYLKLKDGKDFKKDFPHIALEYDPQTPEVTLNYYPRIQMMKSRGKQDPDYSYPDTLNEEKLLSEYQRFLDWDEVYFAIQQYKRSRDWNNLSISKDTLKEIMMHDVNGGRINSGWYHLQIPEEDIKPHDFAVSAKLWQTIAISLLRLYVESFYEWKKGAWTSNNLVSTYLKPDDDNFIEKYRILISKKLVEAIDKLHILQNELKQKTFAQTEKLDGTSEHFKAIFFGQHLYQPLMYLNGKQYETADGPAIIVKPVALVASEKDFINTLIDYLQSSPKLMQGRSIYLLRNQSRKGLGINDVYPDFIMWIIDKKGHQYVTFMEPHGLEHEKGINSPKVALWKFIQHEVQPHLNDKDITLNSFVISPTAFNKVAHWGKSMAELNGQHVYFQQEQHDYMELILKEIIREAEKI